MAAIAQKTKRYPIDLTGEEWERIASLLPKPAKPFSSSYRKMRILGAVVLA